MGKGFFQVPTAINETVKSYAPGSPERASVAKQYAAYFNGSVDVPMYIGKEEVRTGNTNNMTPPHDHQHVVGQYHLGEKNTRRKCYKCCIRSKKAVVSNALGTKSCHIFKKLLS